MKIKICGITNLYDAELCRDLGADMIGFIFYNKSKRNVPLGKAELIGRELSDSVKKVGVFVNQQVEIINKIVNQVQLDLVQLHGDEKPDVISKINVPVIKAFRIDTEFDYGSISTYKNITPLLDTFVETSYGGTGKAFDWYKIPAQIRRISILAGGISENNIEEIVNKIKPYAIDVSSSLERFRGKKDEEKVKRFFNKVKQLRSK